MYFFCFECNSITAGFGDTLLLFNRDTGRRNRVCDWCFHQIKKRV